MISRVRRLSPVVEKRLVKAGVEYPYTPLRLKRLMSRYRIPVGSVADFVKQGNGKSLSRTALTFILNNDLWPKTTDRDAITQQVEHYLRSCEIPQGELAQIWLVDEAMKAEDGHRYTHGGHHPGYSARREPDPEKLYPPEREMLTPAAKKHFKLFRNPFIEEIRGPEDIYLASDQHYIREAMYQNAKNGGFLAVVGESGAGKTTLRLDLIARVQTEQLQILFTQPKLIDKRKLSARMVCEAVLFDLAPHETAPQSLERLARKVERVLIDSYKAGNRHVLIIEEAQDLLPLALKHLKRFYELQSGYQKLLSVILVGQPELKNLLDERQHFELREVIRRCEIAELMPLDKNVKAYLAHKIDRAGSKLGEIFTDDAFDVIVARLSRDSRDGPVSLVYPLVVNNFVTKAMNLAARMGEPKVSAEVIKEV